MLCRGKAMPQWVWGKEGLMADLVVVRGDEWDLEMNGHGLPERENELNDSGSGEYGGKTKLSAENSRMLK